MIVVPIFITYLTNFFTLPKLFEDWKLAVIYSLSILIVILLIELKEALTIRNLPDENDKKIIKKLLNKLDLKSFQDDIYSVDSWNGYSQKAICNITSYQYAAKLIENKTINKKMQQLIDNFSNKLEDFTDFTSNNVYGNNSDFLIPFKDSKDKESVKKDSEKMNRLSKVAFEELEFLVLYLKENKYL